MSIKLRQETNPYSDLTPFEILGVAPSASARDILEARDEKLENLEYTYKGEQRILERQKLMRAYEQLSDSRSRIAVEIFFFDNTVGRKEVTEAAKELVKTRPDVSPVLESEEDVFLTSPSVDHAASQGRNVKLVSSVTLETKHHPFPVKPTSEAAASISFDR